MVPEGYSELHLGSTIAILRSDLAPLLQPLLEKNRTLLGADAGTRGEAPRLLLDGVPPLRVRRYHRGGLLASLLGDLHLSPTRSVAELVALLRARRRGVPVPEPVAAVCDASSAPFVRHELATIEVPDARPFPEVLSACGPPARREWVRRAARAVARLHLAGIDHADLHAGNLLASGDDVVVLDLDRCDLEPSERRRTANLARLHRSVVKSLALSRVVTRADRLRFLRAYDEELRRGGGAIEPVDVRRASRACARMVWWHAWTWKART